MNDIAHFLGTEIEIVVAKSGGLKAQLVKDFDISVADARFTHRGVTHAGVATRKQERTGNVVISRGKEKGIGIVVFESIEDG
ncbi:hypothetical protein [Okeania sp. SIO2C2]|uniref:hypothetical protein n=1 Tax=Okeania sp. SIO2C2 TaxID=2607787 RepID=UPI00257C0D11|nr:hypothetical protein [Okeania sp. SIO2C2]